MDDAAPLAPRIGPAHWESAAGQRWCPIVAFGKDARRLALDAGGRWVLVFGRDGGDVRTPERYPVGASPMLEIPYAAVQRQIAQRADELWVPRESFARAFPARPSSNTP